jgi:hypothetical protein
MAMFKKSGFSLQQQFHLLINFDDDERSITVLPDKKGQFLILDQGTVLGKFDFEKHFKAAFEHCRLSADILKQLINGIRIHYS